MINETLRSTLEKINESLICAISKDRLWCNPPKLKCNSNVWLRNYKIKTEKQIFRRLATFIAIKQSFQSRCLMNNESFFLKFKTKIRWKYNSKTRLPCKITSKKCVLGQLNKTWIKCFLGTILLSPTSLTCFLFQIQGSLL